MDKTKYDLTNPQKSIWLTEKTYPKCPIGNIGGSIIIEELVNFLLLEKAVNILVQKNDSLRFKFIEEFGRVKQYISKYIPFSPEFIELSSFDEIQKLETQMISSPFNLLDSFLFDFKLFKLPNGHGGCTIVVHHLINDAWTTGLIVNEIISIYNSLIKKETLEDLEFPSYSEYIKNEIEYLSSEKFPKDKIFWEELFSTIPELATIPSVTYSPSNVIEYKSKRNQFVISKDILNKVNIFCKDSKTSVFNFFMALFALYISRISGLSDFVIGTPVLNRSNFKEKNTLGMFVSTVPFRISLDDCMDFTAFVSGISKDFSTIFRHQKYPYQNILEHIRETDPSVPNIYDILISYQNIRSTKQTSEISYSSRWVSNECLSDSLQIHIYDMDDTGDFNIAYDYLAAKYSSQDIDNLHSRIMSIIDQILNDPNILLKNIEIVTSSEKNFLVNTFNETFLEYDKSKTVVDLFEERVKLSPHKVALVFEDSFLTYKELNEKANSLAHHLLDSGVSSGDIIGILVNRSLEMIIRHSCYYKVRMLLFAN